MIQPTDKYKFLNHKLLDKSNVALFCIIGMMFGFLMSRAVLSISMIVFGASTLRDINPLSWFKQKWWSLGLCWVAFYAITYFWSDDKSYWNDHLQVKLPILLMPLLFAYIPSFSLKQKQIFTFCTALLLLSGVIYSLSFLIKNPNYYLQAYAISQVLPTPAKQDHIRFSITIALFIIWCVYFFRFLPNIQFKIFVALSAAIFTIYLHILAAKSGLIAFYIFFISFAFYLLFSKKRVIGLAILVSLSLLIGFAINKIPTLKNKLGYISWTYIEYKQGDQSGMYGDINRLMSYKIAFNIIKAHPLAGVGVGDMLTEMKKGYAQAYPQVKEENILLPHNQFLTVALGCGVPIALLFTAWALYPLTWLKKNRESFYFFISWLIVFMQLMIEPVLEIQYGVFVFLFFLLWQKHVLLPKNEKECIKDK